MAGCGQADEPSGSGNTTGNKSTSSALKNFPARWSRLPMIDACTYHPIEMARKIANFIHDHNWPDHNSWSSLNYLHVHVSTLAHCKKYNNWKEEESHWKYVVRLYKSQRFSCWNLFSFLSLNFTIDWSASFYQVPFFKFWGWGRKLMEKILKTLARLSPVYVFSSNILRLFTWLKITCKLLVVRKSVWNKSCIVSRDTYTDKSSNFA